MKTKKNPFLSSTFVSKSISVLVMGSSIPAHAAVTQYQWTGTTSNDWATATNWNASGIAPTGITNTNNRLNINSSVANEAIYTAGLGSTIYGGDQTGQRGLVIGSGTQGNGTLRITGGTFSSAGNTVLDIPNRSDVIGNSGKTGQLIIDGGNYITGASGVRFGTASSGDGTNGMITINSGSLDAASIRSNAANGTINLNGGTATVGYILREAGTATVNFNGGTLQAKQTSTTFVSGLSSANVLAGGAILDTNGFDVTISSALLAGGGGLVKNGAGKLLLSGANTYAGGTTINAGTISVENTGSIGSGAVTDNGTLVINRTSNLTLNNIISGTGEVILSGTAVVNLEGANTYTGTTAVDAGTLNLNGTLTSNVTVANLANLGGEGSTTGSITFDGINNVIFVPGSASALSASAINASTATVSFVPSGSSAAASNIIVMQAAGGITGSIGSNFLENSRMSLSFNGGNTQLLASYTPGSLVWKGNDATSPQQWDAMNTPNWLNTGTTLSDMFVPGDTVLFNDDNAIDSPVFVELHGSLMPGSVTFDNDLKDYELEGNSGGAIEGGASVVMNGSAKVTLKSANTHGGGTTINNGTVEAMNLGSLGTGPVSVASGVTLDLTNATTGSIGYTGISTALSGAGTVNVTLGNYDASRNFNGNNSGFTGVINVGIGAIPGATPPTVELPGVGNGKARFDGALNAAATVNVLENATVYVGNTAVPTTQPATIILKGGDIGEPYGQLRLDWDCVWSGPVTLAGDMTGTDDGTIGSFPGRSGAISGDIGETGGSRALIKTGGGNIALSGNNTFTGETQIRGGGLLVSTTTALGTTAAGTSVSNNASLGLGGGITYPAGEALSIAGQGLTAGNGAFASNYRGALQSVSGDNTWPGDISIVAGSTNNRFGVQDGAQLTLSGTITETEAGRLVSFRHGQTEGSNIIVSGSGNHWTGETQIIGGAGAVILGADNAFPVMSHLRVGSSGVTGQSTLDLNGHAQTCAGLSRVSAGPAFITNNGASPSTLSINPATTPNWAGVIQDGTSIISVIKGGSNIQVFSGTNTYTGTTTVKEGVFQVTGQLAAGSAVTVGGAAATGTPTLTGSGDGGTDGIGDFGIINGQVTIAAANGGAAGTVNPGTVGTVGILHTGAAIIAGTYACDINDITSDQLSVTGNLDLTGATLALNPLVAPAAASYTIATYSGDLTGTFSPNPALPSGYALDYGTTGEIKLVQSTGTAFDQWIADHYPEETNPEIIGADADPDSDGSTNIAEFGFNGNPNSPANQGMIHSFSADSDFDIDTDKELVLTIAVRAGAPVFSGSPSPTLSVDGIDYTVEGSSTLGSFNSSVNVVPTPITTGLSATPGTGYEWRSFSLEGSNGLTGRGFLRAKVQQP